MKNFKIKLFIGIIFPILLLSGSILIAAKAPTSDPAPQPVIIPVLCYHRIILKPTSI